jgi:hypothetical protein
MHSFDRGILAEFRIQNSEFRMVHSLLNSGFWILNSLNSLIKGSRKLNFSVHYWLPMGVIYEKERFCFYSKLVDR